MGTFPAKHKRLLALLFAPLVLVAVGCADDDDDDDGTGDGDGGGTSSNAPRRNDLRDEWRLACATAGTIGASRTGRGEFSDSGFTRELTFHDGTDCGSEAAIQVEESGSFTVGEELREGVFPIDLSYATARVRPLNRVGELALESVRFCGFSDWQVGQARDVTASSGQRNCWQQTPRTEFDIFRLDGDRLVFGEETAERDGTSRERRPTELSDTEVLSRAE